jgi:beta-lactamase regulating signal transducer with metallopeptidase domain
VLVHELSHVRRGDSLIRVVSAANKSLYWFHPLSWWLDSRLAELGELLSDDAALFALPASRAQYAAILSGFMNSLDHLAYRSRVGDLRSKCSARSTAVANAKSVKLLE